MRTVSLRAKLKLFTWCISSIFVLNVSSGHPLKQQKIVGVTCVNLKAYDNESLRNQKIILEKLKMNHILKVRVPLLVEERISKQQPYVVDRKYLESVRDMAKLLADSNIGVILDAHDLRSVKYSPELGKKRLAAFWSEASLIWRHLPRNVEYEVMNEPSTNITASNIVEVIQPSIDAIFKNDSERRIIIGGPNSSNYSSMGSISSLISKSITPTFHFYNPLYFTHQRASWSRKFKNSTPLPLPHDILSKADEAIKAAKRIYMLTGKMPVVGEIGVIRHVSRQDRVTYLNSMVAHFREAGIETCVWTLSPGKDDFDISALMEH